MPFPPVRFILPKGYRHPPGLSSGTISICGRLARRRLSRRAKVARRDAQWAGTGFSRIIKLHRSVILALAVPIHAGKM
jgi:hypothetical protein